MIITEQQRQRFWSRINIKSDSECWEWLGTLRRRNGYGVITIRHKPVFAHRLSYILTRGEIPEGLYVCHTCDNKLCCNPAHLWLGTHADNCADKHQKGRANSPKGEFHYKAILTEASVLEIRKQYASGNKTQRGLAKEYGVDQSTISYAISEKNWKSVQEESGL